MDRKFICDECSKIYSSRQSRWRHKKNDHAKSAPNHSYALQPSNAVKGGNLKTLKKVLQSSHEEPEKRKRHSKEDIEKIVQKVLQSLDEKYEVEDEKEEKMEHQEVLQSLDEKYEVEDEKEEKMEHQEDIENEIFEQVTLEDRKRFYRLLNELKLRKSRLKIEDFEKIDRILPQYFKNEYEYGMRNGIQIQKYSFSAQIKQELYALQRELPMLSLEMQIILTFMDEKRWAIQDLVSIMKSSDKDELLEKKNFRGIISDDEYQELKKDLSRDTIVRVLSNHRFKSMNSEIKYSL